MAHDASERLRELISAGEEIPYVVHEPGAGSPLCRYEPQAELFIRRHAGALRQLDSFGAACAALEATGLGTTYLDQMGIAVPTEPDRHATLAGIVFLCRLWMGVSDFSVDDERLGLAIDELEAGAEVDEGQIEVCVPLRGLQMPISRLDLATASIVRADSVDVPPEARANDGLGLSPWEPAFLAVARVDAAVADDDRGADAGMAAVEAFRRLITTLRLFKAGGVGLGPHAWTRISGDRWRRIATGAGRQRPGGYRLTSPELADLTALSRALGAPGTPLQRRAAGRPGFPTVLGRAINRFEAGLERNVVVEALNDHLLSLRFLLEGGGPANLGLSMRVAALCAEPERRGEVKAVVDRALSLERELWSGEPTQRSESPTPAETAAVLEDLSRAILKDAAAGHLGHDLRATADEILLADGLAVGEGAAEQRGGTTEWDVEPIDAPVDELPGVERELIDELERTIRPDPVAEEVLELDARISPEPTPEPEPEEAMVIERAKKLFNGEVDEPRGSPTLGDESPEAPAAPPADDEGDQERPPSPVLRLIEQTREERKARQARVAELFPTPETTEWSVREVAYDRTRRASVDDRAEVS